MRVMITGGTGFVGLAVAEAVLAQGDTAILVADRPAPPAYLAALGGDIVWHQADLRDPAALAAAFAATRPTHVVHGAALTPAPEQERAAADALVAVNVGGTARLLQAAAGVARVVLLSSVSAYGPAPADQLLTEDRPPAPATLYGISKFAAEMVARRLAALLGLDLVIARLGPVFGPFEYETGVRGLMSPHLQMLRQAMAGTPSVLPWRLAADWIFSRDIGAGVVALLRAELAAAPALFNLGSGVVTDLPAWAAAIAPAFPGWSWRIGEPPTIRYGLTEARAPMDTARLAAAGFRARHDLAEAAAASIAWYRRHAT
jgi:nucleoside-diphosphate-sugar epimerase